MDKLDLDALDSVSGGLSVNSFGAAPAGAGTQTLSPSPSFSPSINPTVNPNNPFGAFDPYGMGGAAPFLFDPGHANAYAPPVAPGGCHPCAPSPCHPELSGNFAPGQAFDPFGAPGLVNPAANVPVLAGSAPSAVGAPTAYYGGVASDDPWANPFSGPTAGSSLPEPSSGGGFGGFGSPF